MQKFCTHCGKKLAEVLQFCTYCGAPLGAKPLNPKLVLTAPPRSPSENPPTEGAQGAVPEDTALEFLPLDFQPLQAAVLRKEAPTAGAEAAGETTEEAASPIVKAAAIIPAAEEAENVPAGNEAAQNATASLDEAQGAPAAAKEAVNSEATEAEAPKAKDAEAKAEGEREAPAADDTHEENAASGVAVASDGTGTEKSAADEDTSAAGPETSSEAVPQSEGKAEEAASDAAPPSDAVASKEAASSGVAEEKKEEAAPPAESSGSLVAWVFRLLVLFVLIVGGLMVYRGVGFDKLREDPAGTVRQLFGQAPAVSGTQEDAFWYPDTKQGALVRGTYDISSGRTVCWYGSTVEKDGRTYANGDGVANWYKSDGSFEQSDEGVFQAGRRDGKIKHTYADGRVETIQWKNGEKVK